MKKHNWALMENGYIHTKDLTKEGAEEMLERYQRTFPELDYYITDRY